MDHEHKWSHLLVKFWFSCRRRSQLRVRIQSLNRKFWHVCCSGLTYCAKKNKNATGQTPRLRLDFLSISSYDHLSVLDGSTETRHCGTATVSWSSRAKSLHLVFKSDSSNVYSGFSLSYSVSNYDCGGVLSGPAGVIASPGYPGSYTNNLQCLWEIKSLLPMTFVFDRLSFEQWQVFFFYSINSYAC